MLYLFFFHAKSIHRWKSEWIEFILYSIQKVPLMNREKKKYIVYFQKKSSVRRTCEIKAINSLLNANLLSGSCNLIFSTKKKKLTKNMFYYLFTALLAGTLRTYQKAGCDAEYIALSCPRGTSISIEIAQYGNTLKGNCSFFFISNTFRFYLEIPSHFFSSTWFCFGLFALSWECFWTLHSICIWLQF